MRNERLAGLRTDYDEASHTLTIGHEGREVARGDLRTTDGRLTIEAFFCRFVPHELRGPPKMLHAENHSFSACSQESGFHHQHRLSGGGGDGRGRSGASVALSLQYLCDRLAGLA
jgi:hypothetical protein